MSQTKKTELLDRRWANNQLAALFVSRHSCGAGGRHRNEFHLEGGHFVTCYAVFNYYIRAICFVYGVLAVLLEAVFEVLFRIVRIASYYILERC